MNTLPTLARLASDLAEGRASARSLAEAALARAEDAAGEGARAFTLIDRPRALALAAASDALRKAGTGEYRKKKREITFHYLSHPVISCCSFSIFPVFPPSLSAHL